MRSLICIVVLAIILTTCSCASVSKTATLQTPFDGDLHEPYTREGKSTVTGQAFHRTIGGEVRYAAGCRVAMTPATAYGREVIDVLKSGKNVENFDPAWSAIALKATADGEGRFAFANVPPGEWYVVTSNYWQAGPGLAFQGGHLGELISVPEEGSIEVILTQPPWAPTRR